MRPNTLPDGKTHYELMLTERVERDLLADHREISFGEQYTPSFPLSVLIDDYLAEQDLETKTAYRDDIILRNHAVEEIFAHAKDTHEYQKVWDARVKAKETGDYYPAEKLAGRLRGKIEQRLMNAANPKVKLYDVDDPNADLEALLEAEVEEAAAYFSKRLYDEQERTDALRKEDNYAFEFKRGQDEGEIYFRNWLTEPIAIENEVRRIRTLFDEGSTNLEGQKIPEAFVLGVEDRFNKLRLKHELGEYVTESNREAVKAKEALARAKEGRGEPASEQQTLGDAVAANANVSPEERQQRTAAAAEKIQNEKEGGTKVTTNTNNSSRFGSSRSVRQSGGSSTSQQKQNGDARIDAGFYNYDTLPDGDQLYEEEAPGLADPANGDDVVYRPHNMQAREEPKQNNMDRMHDVQRNYPKQGKQMAQAVQAGAALGRVIILPDPEEVEVQKVSFKRRPGRWLKVKAAAFYLRHRKSLNIVAKMTAFIALQLGAATLAGRFEFKEDRHFVQMVLMTVMGFVLTSSLAKDGVPVNNAAFIL